MGTISYSRNGEVLEINIRESNGRKIETHRCDVNDKKKAGQIMKFLKDKYNFSPEIDIEDSVNANGVDWW